MTTATADLLSSMLLPVALFTLAVVICMFLWRWCCKTLAGNKGLPPGPIGLPVIGCIHLLSNDHTHKDVTKLSEQYGDVFSMYLGNRRVVYVCGYEAIKEALVTKSVEFAGRPNLNFVKAYNPHRHGIVEPDYTSAHKEQMQFIHSKLRQLGFGKVSFQIHILREVEKLMDYLRVCAEREEPANLNDQVMANVANVTFSALFNKQFAADDPTLRKLISDIAEFFKAVVRNAIGEFLPFMRLFNLDSWGNCIKVSKDIQSFCSKHVAILKEGYNGEVNSFVESYLRKIEEVEGKFGEKEGDGNFSLPQLERVCMDLVMAGMETTSTSILWGVLAMMHFPQEFERALEELDRVVGKKRLVTIEDKPELPYCDALTLELLRWSSIAPFTLNHATTVDTTLRGYRIPKDTMIMINLWSVHRSKGRHWDAPEVFRPSRFMDENGNVSKEDLAFLPFSAGRRSCPGQTLAKMELFLFFTNVMKAFHFEPAPGEDKPSLDAIFGLTLQTTPFEIVVQAR